jgi:hypothetical protein
MVHFEIVSLCSFGEDEAKEEMSLSGDAFVPRAVVIVLLKQLCWQ